VFPVKYELHSYSPSNWFYCLFPHYDEIFYLHVLRSSLRSCVRIAFILYDVSEADYAPVIRYEKRNCHTGSDSVTQEA
jgi:hypothetical protein